MKLRTIIIEDEDDNRVWLNKKLNEFSELEVIGEALTLDEAFNLIAKTKPDAAFMDIQLIGGDAFQLLQRLKDNSIQIPFIVMTTGYPEYVMDALNQYRKYVVQYLVKPFVDDWKIKLRKAIDALLAAQNQDINLKADLKETAPTHAYFNTHGNLLRLNFSEISYLEAAGGGESYVVTDFENHQIDMTLNKFMEHLPLDQFIRVSKNNIVNLKRIQKINREERTLEVVQQNGKGKSIGIGDAFYSDLIKKLPLLKDRLVKVDKIIDMSMKHLKEEETQIGLPSVTDVIYKNRDSNIVESELVDPKKYEMLTMLIAGIKEFPPALEDLDSIKMVQEISSVYKIFDEVLLKYNLKKIKSVGNYYMCVGGLSANNNDSTKKILLAAIEMLKVVTELKNIDCYSSKVDLKIQIGVHSGSAIIADNRNFNNELDIWGETVKIVESLQQNSQIGKISISARTYEFVKTEFPFIYAGCLKVLNKYEIDYYYVV